MFFSLICSFCRTQQWFSYVCEFLQFLCLFLISFHGNWWTFSVKFTDACSMNAYALFWRLFPEHLRTTVLCISWPIVLVRNSFYKFSQVFYFLVICQVAPSIIISGILKSSIIITKLCISSFQFCKVLFYLFLAHITSVWF